MSNKKVNLDEIENKSIEVIKPEAVIELPISGSFYGRLNKLLISVAAKLELKDYVEILAKFKEDFKFEAKTEDEANIQTLLALIASIEAGFAQDKSNYDIQTFTEEEFEKLKQEYADHLERDVD